jgi:hypothetical protein
MEIKRIQEIIENSKIIGLTIKKGAGETELLAREALRILFQTKGLSVFCPQPMPEIFKSKWGCFLDNPSLPLPFNKILIRFPKENFEVKEINYEDGPEFLTLKVFSGKNKFEKNNILVETELPTLDAIFHLGPEEEKNLAEILTEVVLPDKEKIIFITPEETTFSEKIFEIADFLGINFSTAENNFANLLLASLLTETGGLKKNLSERSLIFANRLLSLGADKKTIDEIINKNLPLPLAQLLGRALARTRTDNSLKSNWTFISRDDFEKTGIDNADLPLLNKLISRISEIVPEQPLFIVLWEDKNKKVWGLLDYKEALFKKEIEKITGPYKSFSEAELELRKNLKEIL